MKYLLIILLFLISAVAPLSSKAEEPPGQIAIFPSMFELPLGSKPVNQAIRLKNLKKNPVTIKVDVYNWTLDQQNELQTIPPTAQSLDRWMIVNPLLFTIEPNQEQVVRFSIRPDVQPEPGEHRAIIYFTEQPSTKEASAAVEVVFRIGVGIYGYTDPVKRSGQLNSLAVNGNNRVLKADITNNGNVHVRLKGEYSIWTKGKFPGFERMKKLSEKDKADKANSGFIASGSMNNMPVLPGSRRIIETPLPIQGNGNGYTIAVSGELNGQKVEKIFP